LHADFHAAAFATLKGEPAILFGTDGGLFLSTDGGVSFSSLKNDGISSYSIYAMTGNPKHAADVLIGLQDDGTRFRTGTSGTYNQVFGGDGFGVGWSQADDLVTLGSVYYSFIIRNQRNPPNTQSKWLVGWIGIREFFLPAWTYFNTSIATPRASADPAALTFFHRTRFRLYRTTNGAVSWTCIMETPPTAMAQLGASPECSGPAMLPTPTPPPDARILLRAGSHPIGVSPESLNHFGVLANGGWFYSTTDGGESWVSRSLTTIAPPWPGFNSTLAYASNSTLYVGNEAPIGTAMRVIKSTNGGNTWTDASMGLPAVPITKIVVHPQDPNTLYAGTWIGVYQTTNGNTSWQLHGQGLPIVPTTDLYLAPDGSYLRVSTYGRGVWETRF
jgi:Photosynthesis system II assembly factor YCF48